MVSAGNDVIVSALSSQDIMSISVGGAISDTVSIDGSVSKLTVNTITQAYITGAEVIAGGSVIVSATGASEIDVLAGGLAYGDAAGIGVFRSSFNENGTGRGICQ